MKSILVTTGLCLMMACGSDRPDQAVNRDTLTQRQKDSIIANSRLPGAGAVKRAMAASDSISGRVLRADTLASDTTHH